VKALFSIQKQIGFGNPGFAVDMKRAGREVVYGKLHARRAKRFFSNSFPVL
jgi:hypothetical protein